MNISIDNLSTFCVEAMSKCGMAPEAGRIGAEVLVTTDAWGIHSHGTKSLRQYLKRMRAGGINATAEPRIETQGPAWAIVNGHNALAMVSGYRAMEIAVEKAKNCGLAYVGVKGSCHFGAAGFYANMAASQGMMGLAMSNVDPNMTIPGAKGRNIGSNPIAYAVPRSNKRAIFFDVALSTVAAGKVDSARFEGKKIPADWLMDMEGVPTTDPNLYPQNACLAPMSKHKGYGLALMVEILSAVLTGAEILKGVKSWVLADPREATGQGHCFIVIDVASVMGSDLFDRRMEMLVRQIHNMPKGKGSNGPQLPGEREWDNYERSVKAGIDLPNEVVTSLKGLAEDLTIKFI